MKKMVSILTYYGIFIDVCIMYYKGGSEVLGR